MAHDKQYKDATSHNLSWHGVELAVDRFDYPKEGELFWNRYAHQVEEADRDMEEKFLIVRRVS